MPEITVQGSRLSSVLPKKNPMAQGNGLSRDSTNADTTTAIDESKEMPMKIKRNLA